MSVELNSGQKPGKSLLKDFSWYLLSSFFPLLVGFIKTPIFTRHFGTEEFGNLGIVQVTFSYLGMLLFSWISSILWRYYQKFKLENRLEQLFGTLLIFFGISMVLLVVGSGLWYSFETKPLIRQLILVSFGHLFLSQLVMGYLVAVRLESRAQLFTIFQSARAVLSFFVSLYLVFAQDASITALIAGLLVIDALALAILVLWNPIRLLIRFSAWSSVGWKELFTYGMGGLVMNLSILSLNLSDRYVILASEGLSSVGIYDQVYKISQLSVMALVTVFFNTVNPGLFKELEQDLKASVQSMSGYLLGFIAFGLPLVVYLSLFSEEISNVLLGAAFRGAYSIMPFVFFAAFFQGISNFWELRMKFSDRMRVLSTIFLTGALFNLLLNLWLVPLHGYEWAAISTLITFVLLVTVLCILDRDLIRALYGLRQSLRIPMVVLALQLLIFTVVDNFVRSMSVRVVIGVIFVLSYGWFVKDMSILRNNNNAE
jgi:O-antigen/teichoic acid export membrane protein